MAQATGSKRELKMSKKPKSKAVCEWCGATLSSDHIGPCPKCGKLGKKISTTITENFCLKDSLNWKKRREFFEQNTKIKWLIIAITIGSPIVGFFVIGLIGVVIGLALGIISYALGPYAVIKVREIERGNSN